MTINEILDIVGYVVAYFAVGLGLSPLILKVDRQVFGGKPPRPPTPTFVGLLILTWPVPAAIWALFLALDAAAVLVTGLGRLACWLAGAEGERAAGGAEET